MSIGYACIIIGAANNTTISRCLLKNATDDKIREITVANLLALESMIDYNIKNNIFLFRISSDIIPFGSHPVNNIDWKQEFKDIFSRIGNKIKNAGIRVSMHPGQYTVLNSPLTNIAENAVSELQYHALFLEALNTDITSKIVLHIGGVYGDKAKAMDTFIKNFNNLPDCVKHRLVIENDDKNYNIQDVLEISKVTKIPVVFDNLHNMANPSDQKATEYEWIELCASTWASFDGKQKIHYSQKKHNGKQSAHSITINVKEFSSFYENLHNKNIDIMLEVKDKNLSAIKCINATNNNLSIGRIEQEWAKYKYFVLGSSATLYNDIRNMLKDKESVDVISFYDIIDTAIYLPENKGAQINAAQHIWGYLNKKCSEAEKKRFEKLSEGYLEGIEKISSLKNHLFKCSKKQNVEYLINSYYFYL